MMVQVRIDTTNEINKVMSILKGAGKKPEPVIKKAVNEAAKNAKRKLRERVKKEYVIKGFSADDIKINKASVSKLYAELSVSGSPLSLKEYYKVVDNRKRAAAKAAVKRGAAKALQGKGLKAFVATMNNGEGKNDHTGVFQRIPGQYMRKQEPRKYKRNPSKMTKGKQAIKELMGPAISKLTEKISQATEPEIKTELIEALRKFVDETLNGK